MPTANLTIMDVHCDPRIYDHRPSGILPEAILLHHTGGTNSLNWLSRYLGPTVRPEEVSIHKLVPKRMPDGKPGLYQIVPDLDRAWHAGASVPSSNDFSIGVEIENLGNGRDPYTLDQYETVAQIIAYGCALYHIKDFWVRLHKEIAVPLGRKHDPDPSFSMVRVWGRVRELRANWPYAIPAWRG